MRKLLYILILLLLSLPAYAKNKIIAQSLQSFSSEYPKTQITLRVTETNIFKSGFMLEGGAIIHAYVIKISDPKRGKRNAYILIRPISYTVPSEGHRVMKFKNNRLEAKVTAYKKMDKKQATEKGAVSATGFVLPGFSPMYYFSKGCITSEEDENRITSGGKLAYKNSIFSFVEKGDNLVLKKGSYVKLKFYDSEKPKWKIFKTL